MGCHDMINLLVAAHGESSKRGTLTVEDIGLIHQLSPQGVAKINADIIKGVPLDQVMYDLKTAYVNREYRINLLKRRIPKEVRGYLKEFQRPLTVPEILLFIKNPMDTIKADVATTMELGNSMEDALEHVAYTSFKEEDSKLNQSLVPTRLFSRRPSRPKPTVLSNQNSLLTPNYTDVWFSTASLDIPWASLRELWSREDTLYPCKCCLHSFHSVDTKPQQQTTNLSWDVFTSESSMDSVGTETSSVSGGMGSKTGSLRGPCTSFLSKISGRATRFNEDVQSYIYFSSRPVNAAKHVQKAKLNHGDSRAISICRKGICLFHNLASRVRLPSSSSLSVSVL